MAAACQVVATTPMEMVKMQCQVLPVVVVMACLPVMPAWLWPVWWHCCCCYCCCTLLQHLAISVQGCVMMCLPEQVAAVEGGSSSPVVVAQRLGLRGMYTVHGRTCDYVHAHVHADAPCICEHMHVRAIVYIHERGGSIWASCQDYLIKRYTKLLCLR